ncbi:putative mitochondrial protein [Dendrobium catenatum]|uniref:Putative mitochondrial protein n=1 Tax=Dendrobium catenatum TaxID=906689 RepID=A0A2I0VGZ3_9ASPA|nr:putative mitochondrial protein [Dendrobium catenatum]
MLPTLPQKGAAFIPPKMSVPPSGPSKQHNSVLRLCFIPEKVVYGSKRLVPSGANPLHH